MTRGGKAGTDKCQGKKDCTQKYQTDFPAKNTDDDYPVGRDLEESTQWQLLPSSQETAREWLLDSVTLAQSKADGFAFEVHKYAQARARGTHPMAIKQMCQEMPRAQLEEGLPPLHEQLTPPNPLGFWVLKQCGRAGHRPSAPGTMQLRHFAQKLRHQGQNRVTLFRYAFFWAVGPSFSGVPKLWAENSMVHPVSQK